MASSFVTLLYCHPETHLLGILDHNGQILCDAKFYDISNFSDEGLACARFSLEGDAQWGYINIKGETIIPPTYYDAQPFSEGLAAVSLLNSWGYIDAKGKIKIKCQFEKAYAFDQKGFAKVGYHGHCGFINKKGKWLIEPKFDWWGLGAFSSNNLAKARFEEGKSFFINRQGDIVLKPRFKSFYEFSEDLCLFKMSNNRYGFMNAQGKAVIPAHYEEAVDFSHGLAKVLINGSWGFINKKNELVIAPEFKNNTAEISLEDVFKVGLEKAIPRPHISSFSPSGLAFFEANGVYGAINTSGDIIIPTQYTDISEETAEIFLVTTQDGREGYIRRDGSWIGDYYQSC